MNKPATPEDKLLKSVLSELKKLNTKVEGLATTLQVTGMLAVLRNATIIQQEMMQREFDQLVEELKNVDNGKL